MMSLTSNELNYLIFRYFHESGLTHSAFALGCEAGIDKSAIDGNMVPPGALVTFVQKGIQYLELEANLTNEDVDMDEEFQFVQPLDLITKDPEELQKIIKEKKEEKLQRDKPRGRNKDVENNRGLDHVPVKGKEKEKQPKEMEQEREKVDKDKERDKGKDKDKEKEKEKEKVQEGITEVKMAGDKMVLRIDEDGHNEEPEPMEICPSTNSTPCEIPSSDVAVLEGHSSEVFACTWSPDGSLLASGSGDATARIWSVGDPKSSSSMQNGPPDALVLKHFKVRTNEKSRDVTTLDWNSEGTLLATGSYDGQARIWNREGELISTLNKHKGPIFSLKWNKKGDYLLSGSVDKTAIVWDVKTGEWKQQFEFHTDPTLDVDWRNNVSFATCSTDRMIYVCKVGENRPIKTFSGHQSEVNAIKWDPSGSLLASCSDDTTAKIWSVKSDTCLHDFREHTKEIYTVRWSPTGPGTSNPNQQLMLASASFDSTIKLWDVEAGRLVNSLNGHSDAVYSVAFSPNGQYLASGSLDRCVNIWSVKDAKVVKRYSGNGGIFEVCWNKEGNRLAAGFANNIVCIIDFRM